MPPIRRTAAALVTVAAVAATLFGTAGSASANPGESFLYRGQTLNAGDQIQRSITGGDTFVLIMQGDGNLVEYHYSHWGPAVVCWASNTSGSSTDDHAVYQQDGNFVVYTPWGQAVWASNTVGVGGSTVDINANGVVYVGYRAINPACFS